jgi:LuxR family maltose regulon positive regulatory protein
MSFPRSDDPGATGSDAPVHKVADAGADPVMALRLRPPMAPAHRIDRPGVQALLSAHAQARVVLFCAPAGFGKTTAMRDHWAACAEAPVPALVSWLTLDDADNDVNRFLSKLRAAARGLPGLLQPGQAATPAELLQGGFTLLQRLEGGSRPVVCFLDDFERLRNPVALDLVHELLAHWPRNGYLVIGSREQPRLNLSVLRSSGRLLEIGPEALRLTLAEAHALLRGNARPLSNRTVEQLHERTEGWVTALQLAAHALQRHAAPDQFASAFSGSHSSVAEYLMESVLAGLPPRLRDFVMMVGLLEEFDADMARAVTGYEDASELLEALLQQNLFLSAVDETRQRFRFHGLFANFLQTEAARRQPARVAQVHRAASQWRLDQGSVVPAIHHALAAGDQALTLDLLQAHAERLLLQGRFRLLSRWFDALGPALREQRPALVPFHACALALTRRQPEALRLLDELEASESVWGVDRDWVGAVRGLAHAMLDQADRCLDVSLRHHRTDEGPRSGAPHGMLANALASALITATRFDEAMVVLTTAKRWHWNTGSAFNMTIAECVHANLELVQGRLQDACSRLETTLASRTGAEAHSPGGNAALGVGLATALYARNRLPEANRLLLGSLPFTKEVGPPDTVLLNHLLLARCAHAQGDTELGHRRLAEMERFGHAAGLERLVSTAWLERARLALAQGQPDQAGDYLAQAAMHPAVWALQQDFPANANDVEDLALGRLRWQVRAGDAVASIEPLRQAAREAQDARRRVRASLLRLLLAEALQRDGQALAALREASDVCEWCALTGHQRLLIDEGPAMAPLLQAVLASPLVGGQPHLVDFLAPVLAAWGQPAVAQTVLSEREMEVLQMLAEGRGNREVGARLFISENTVKAHLRSVNAKLEAGNRTQAVSNARRLGLLP